MRSSWLPPGPGEAAGASRSPGPWWRSAGVSRTLWVMKRWRDREDADVKQAPQCRHCWPPPAAPSVWCWGMCSRKTPWSSVVNPQGAQRKPDSREAGGVGETAVESRVLLAGLVPPADASSGSGLRGILRPGTHPEPPSCSEELSSNPLAPLSRRTAGLVAHYRLMPQEAHNSDRGCGTSEESWLTAAVPCLS